MPRKLGGIQEWKTLARRTRWLPGYSMNQGAIGAIKKKFFSGNEKKKNVYKGSKAGEKWEIER